MRSSRLVVVESLLSACFGAFALATLVRRDWIEMLPVDPDGGSGALEWVIVAALLCASIGLGRLAHRGRAIRTPPSGSASDVSEAGPPRDDLG